MACSCRKAGETTALRRGADDGWAGPILMRPHVSGSCTRVEEPTGDKTGGLERRQGGMGGVSLGDKSSFFMFYWDVKSLVRLEGLPSSCM